MSKELGGYGPTAGTHVGGTGANLNERPDNSKPGGAHMATVAGRAEGIVAAIPWTSRFQPSRATRKSNKS